MLKYMFNKEYTYVSFDDFQVRQMYYDAPVKFIRSYHDKIISDEVQYLPELLSQIKIAVDSDLDAYGKFLVTVSGQFLLSRHISESLAGRIGIIPLLPFQYAEIPQPLCEFSMYKGGFPELVGRDYQHDDLWFKAYIETYLQKDLRQLINVTDLHFFILFVRMLALHAGQILNLSSFSREIGVAVNTLKRWLSVLESSYLVFLLNPIHGNPGKRMIKSPKIYFFDTGLLAFLAGIKDKESCEHSPLYAALFENYIIAEILKAKFHRGLNYELYFLRTSHGEEVDLALERNNELTLIEIKSGFTYRPQFINALSKFLPIARRGYLIYQGEQRRLDTQIVAENWEHFLKGFPESIMEM